MLESYATKLFLRASVISCDEAPKSMKLPLRRSTGAGPPSAHYTLALNRTAALRLNQARTLMKAHDFPNHPRLQTRREPANTYFVHFIITAANCSHDLKAGRKCLVSFCPQWRLRSFRRLRKQSCHGASRTYI
jgi:hypothetical protein